MPDETRSDAIPQPLEIGRDLLGIRIDIFGEHVLVHGATRRAVNEQQVLQLDANRQSTEKLPPAIAQRLLGLELELLTGPETGAFCSNIEVVGLVEHRLIMVAAQAESRALDNQIEALARTGTIPDDISQTDDILDASAIDVSQNGFERLEIAMNIGDGSRSCSGSCESAWPPQPGRHKGPHASHSTSRRLGERSRGPRAHRNR